MKLNTKSLDEKLQKALVILGKRYEFQIGEQGEKLNCIFKKGKNLEIRRDKEGIYITYPQISSLFRAIGHVVQKDKEGIEVFNLKEVLYFPFNGLMVDCSRNGVLKVEYAKEIIERMAIMGHSTLMLYMEDVYEIEDEPYFGYMRGKYTQNELQAIDQYALQFGIEVIPCIQTLAHLDQFLMWDEMSEKYMDIDNILCVGEEAVTQLLHKMIKRLSETFTSRRIHIGMDEAYRLGRGRYADKHGLEAKTDIMRKHLIHMVEITKQYKLRPIIWDDMFFSQYSRVTEDTYKIPEGIDLMYWDYYHNTQAHYEENIERRRGLRKETMFAGGGWRWIGYTPHHSKTLVATSAALMACKRKGVEEVIATAWADDGCESPISTCLFGTMLFAEHGYNKEVRLEIFKKRLAFCTGLSYEDYMKQEAFDILPEFKDMTTTVTPSKYMFYEDPLCSLFVYHMKHLPTGLTTYYEELHTYFIEVSKQEDHPMYKVVKELYAAYAKVLSLKWNLGMNIYEAYGEGDKRKIEEIIKKQINPLLEDVEVFRMKRFKEWEMSNKSIGFEVLDLRIGGILQRLKTTKYILNEYISGAIEEILELEEKRMPVTHFREEGMGEIVHFNQAQRSMTASRMTW